MAHTKKSVILSTSINGKTQTKFEVAPYHTWIKDCTCGEAQLYCFLFNYNGHKDWRLPTANLRINDEYLRVNLYQNSDEEDALYKYFGNGPLYTSMWTQYDVDEKEYADSVKFTLVPVRSINA